MDVPVDSRHGMALSADPNRDGGERQPARRGDNRVGLTPRPGKHRDGIGRVRQVQPGLPAVGEPYEAGAGQAGAGGSGRDWTSTTPVEMMGAKESLTELHCGAGLADCRAESRRGGSR